MKTNGKTAYPERPGKVAGPHELEIGKLACSIAAHAPHDGTFDLRIPGLHASRFSRINTVGVHASSCLPCASSCSEDRHRGAGSDEYDALRMLVFSVALPVAAQITQASSYEPYLALRLGPRPAQDRRAGP